MIQAQPIRRMLVSVDVQSDPGALLHDAGSFAAALGAELHVVHALGEGLLAQETGSWLDTQKRLHERRIALHGLVTEEVPKGVRVRSARVVLGSPAEVIPREAVERRADLILLGRHRPRMIGDRFVGSTAEKVVRNATVPCLLLNGRVSMPVRRILVPADFTARSRLALRRGVLWLRTLSNRGPVDIDFVHVVNGGEAASGSVAAIRAELEDEVRTATRAADVRVRINVEVVEGGEPGSELLHFAETVGSDLVVMGTRGDSILMRSLLGSVSSEMLRKSTLPLLLVPPLALIDGDEPEPVPEPASWVPVPLPH